MKPNACLIAASVALWANSASGDWQLVDDFENGNSFVNPGDGSPGLIVADPGNPANSMLEVPAGQATLRRQLTGGEIVSDGTVGTLFWQGVAVSGRLLDTLAGLTDSDSNSDWAGYVCYGGFVNENGTLHFRARQGDEAGGGTNDSVFSPMQMDAPYDIWLVADLVANRYDIHLDGPGLNGQTLVADDFQFRRTGDPDALDFIQIKEGGFGDDSLLVDNFYIDTSGENLTKPPIPGVTPFEITQINLIDGDSLVLGWTAIPGHAYALDRSDDLATWREIEDGIAAQGTTAGTQVTGDDAIAPGGTRYFRIRDLGSAGP